MASNAMTQPPASPCLPITGRVLGSRWRVGGQIGADTTGMVFQALDLGSGRQAAIKVLHARATPDLSPHARFVREARALAAFGHPGIASVQDLGVDGETRFLVTDLINGLPLDAMLSCVRQATGPSDDGSFHAPRSGRSIADALAARATPSAAAMLAGHSWWHAVATMLAEVAATVEAAHACGITHRGLRSSSLMLRGNGSLVVVDFGLAGFPDQSTAREEQAPERLAPVGATEPAYATSSVGAPCDDIHQLGLVMYELLTLRSANAHAGAGSGPVQLAFDDLPPPRAVDARIPLELEAICLMATARAPEHRYQTMQSLAEDLVRFVQGKELPRAARCTAAGNLVLRARYAARHHRTHILFAAAGLLGLFVARCLSLL